MRWWRGCSRTRASACGSAPRCRAMSSGSARRRWISPTPRATANRGTTPTSGSSSTRWSATPRCSSAPTRWPGPGASSTPCWPIGSRPRTRSRCTTRPPGDPRKPPSSSSAMTASGATFDLAPGQKRPCRPGLGGQRGVHFAPAAVDLQAGPLPDGPEAPPPGSAAVVMAADVAGLPSTGITPVICGDAHLGNFGFYASPQRDLVIDLNDFDEAHPGGWEWDLRRLVASIWVAGRQNGAGEAGCEAAVRQCVAGYRAEVRALADTPLLARSYQRLDV